MLKNEVKKPSYLVGSRLGSILGDFLRKLGDFFSKSSGHTDILRRAVELGGPTAKSAYNSKLLSIFLLDYRSGQELQVKKEVGDCRFLPSDYA